MVNPNGLPKNGGEGTRRTKKEILENMTDQELLDSIRKKSQKRGSSVAGAINKKFVTGTLAGFISLGVATGVGYIKGRNDGKSQNLNGEQTTEITDGSQQPAPEISEGGATGEEGINPEVIGIDDKAYFEPGQYFDMNADKPSEFAISEAETIAQSIGSHKLKDVTNEIIKVSENFSGYLAAMPEEHLPDDLKGIEAVHDFEKDIESRSPEEYDKLKKDYLEKLEKYATPALILVNGSYSSHYDALNFEGKYLGRKKALEAMDKDEINHENMEAVGSKGIQKRNEIVLGYVWQDSEGNIIGIQPLDLAPKLAEGYEYDASTRTITMPDGSKKQMTVNGAIVMDEIGGEGKVVKEFEKRYCMQNLWTEAASASKLGNIPIVEITQDEQVIPHSSENNNNHEDPDDPSRKKPKDSENLIEIDNNIIENNESDRNTNQINVYQHAQTEQASPNQANYQGVSPEIVQNTESQTSEPVYYEISGDNDYSFDYSPAIPVDNLVSEDKAGEDAANKSEQPIESAPTSGQELDDALSSLGIN